MARVTLECPSAKIRSRNLEDGPSAKIGSLENFRPYYRELTAKLDFFFFFGSLGVGYVRMNPLSPSQWAVFCTGKIIHVVMRFIIPYYFMSFGKLVSRSLSLSLFLSPSLSPSLPFCLFSVSLSPSYLSLSLSRSLSLSSLSLSLPPSLSLSAIKFVH